jgi:predicted GIY-YIG superfamily endonuclease
MTKTAIIYGLTSITGDVYYVGGTNDLKRRLREHKTTFGRIDAT